MGRHRNINHTLKEIRQRRYKVRARVTRFIPDADRDFASMARVFAAHVAAHAQRFGVSSEQINELDAAVTAFRDALSRSLNRNTAGPKATRLKNDARAQAEEAVRAAARTLRAAKKGTITSEDRVMLNLPERPQRVKRQECPQVAPVLVFKGSTSPQALGGRHVLEYENYLDEGYHAKPRGAARLELFVELVPEELAKAGKVPVHPGQLRGGCVWYLRSFTTRRFEVEYPVMADGSAALVVYWARWADASGGVGPFSKTCVARVEGGMQLPIGLPGKQSKSGGQIRVEQVVHYLEAKQVLFASQMLPVMDGDTEPLPGAGVRLLEAA